MTLSPEQLSEIGVVKELFLDDGHDVVFAHDQ